ncbi:uncharacterized protein LOC144439452 [Glandiceps talaboti]
MSMISSLKGAFKAAIRTGKIKQVSQSLEDTILTPHMFGADLESFTTTAIRPDITIIDTTSHEVFLVEVSVPFDGHIDRCYTEKFDKYIPLSFEINNLGFFCRIVVIVIGSLGSVHKRVIPGFKLIGIPHQTKKWLARYLSVSAAIGSFRTWQRRCKDMNV